MARDFSTKTADEIVTDALERPSSAVVDGDSARQHDLSDIMDAARMVAEERAKASNNLGIKRMFFRSNGTVR